MSKRIREKEKRKPEAQSFSLESFWAEKKPVLLFVLGFAALMGVFYAFWFSEIFKTNILDPVVRVNALVASKVLNLFGFGTSTNGVDIFSSATSFSVSVKQGCDGLEPIAIYTFAVLLFPVSFRRKGWGILAGIPFLLLLNQVRIISLYVCGVYSPTLFKIMHVQVWQAIFIAITLLILAYWIVWALRKDGITAANSA